MLQYTCKYVWTTHQLHKSCDFHSLKYLIFSELVVWKKTKCFKLYISIAQKALFQCCYPQHIFVTSNYAYINYDHCFVSVFLILLCFLSLFVQIQASAFTCCQFTPCNILQVLTTFWTLNKMKYYQH